MTVKYAHLIEKARVTVAQNAINDARHWDHMRGMPACCSNKPPGTERRISKCEITSQTHGHPRCVDNKSYIRVSPLSGYKTLSKAHDPHERMMSPYMIPTRMVGPQIGVLSYITPMPWERRL